MLSCNRYINQTKFKNYFLYDMLRAHTFCGCFISLRARYVHAYKRALTFLRPVFIKKCYKNPIPIVQKPGCLNKPWHLFGLALLVNFSSKIGHLFGRGIN